MLSSNLPRSARFFMVSHVVLLTALIAGLSQVNFLYYSTNYAVVREIQSMEGVPPLPVCDPSLHPLRPFHAFSLPYLDLPLHFHCLSLTFHCRSSLPSGGCSAAAAALTAELGCANATVGVALLGSAGQLEECNAVLRANGFDPVRHCPLPCISTVFTASKTVPLPCVSTVFTASKTAPLPCGSTVFTASKTLPLPCVSTAFKVKIAPFLAVLQDMTFVSFLMCHIWTNVLFRLLSYIGLRFCWTGQTCKQRLAV